MTAETDLVSALAESIERLIQPVLHTSLGRGGYGSPRMTVAVCRSCQTPNAGTEGHAEGCPVPAAKALLELVRS